MAFGFLDIRADIVPQMPCHGIIFLYAAFKGTKLRLLLHVAKKQLKNAQAKGYDGSLAIFVVSCNLG